MSSAQLWVLELTRYCLNIFSVNQNLCLFVFINKFQVLLSSILIHQGRGCGRALFQRSHVACLKKTISQLVFHPTKRFNQQTSQKNDLLCLFLPLQNLKQSKRNSTVVKFRTWSQFECSLTQHGNEKSSLLIGRKSRTFFVAGKDSKI